MDLSTLYGADLEFRDLNKTDVYLCPQVAPTEREKKEQIGAMKAHLY